MLKLLIGVIIVAVGTLITFMVIDPNISINSIDNTTLISAVDENHISVYIEGEIVKPGNYILENDAIMRDLIIEAGGINEYADELAYFETAPLEGGKTYYIPSKYDRSNVCSLTEIKKVNINEDSVDELLTIKVFTSSLANSVVSYREQIGEFMTLEQLEEVHGIGPSTYRKLRDYVTLHE